MRAKLSPIEKYLGTAFLAWGGFWFIGTFLLLYPFFILMIWIKPLKKFTYVLNKIWCLVFFPTSALFIKEDWQDEDFDYRKPVVYVCNHGSYIDIPVLTWVLPGFICFLGKRSLEKVPLFGYMFKNLHVMVDRSSSTGRYQSFNRSLREIDKGRSLVIFPEGTIHGNQPMLHSFKDGAFRMAINRQVPVVPVTIGYNWYALPDRLYIARPKFLHVTIHKPVATTGMKEEDAEALSAACFQTIDAELKRLNKITD